MLKQIITNPTVLSILTGQARHLLTIGGAALATKGYIGAEDVSTGVGALMVLVSMVLSAFSKKMGA